MPRGYINCSYMLWMTKNGSHETKICMFKRYVGVIRELYVGPNLRMYDVMEGITMLFGEFYPS